MLNYSTIKNNFKSSPIHAQRLFLLRYTPPWFKCVSVHFCVWCLFCGDSNDGSVSLHFKISSIHRLSRESFMLSAVYVHYFLLFSFPLHLMIYTVVVCLFNGSTIRFGIHFPTRRFAFTIVNPLCISAYKFDEAKPTKN